MYLLNVICQVVSIDKDLINELPLVIRIIAFMAGTIFVLGAGIKYGIDAYVKTKSLFKKKKEISVDQLKMHSFFSKCESWSTYKVNELYFGDDVRNKLFRAIISTKIEVMSNNAMTAFCKPEVKDFNKKVFQSYVFKLITDIHTNTETEIRNKIISMYPTCGNGVYELVMNHEDKGFNAFNQITDNYTERLVQIICESDMYDDNYEKCEMILDAFKASLGAAFPHIESAFKGFNGELDKLIKKE